MANYAHAKEIIAANVYTNHDGQVTAEKAKTAINEVVDTLIAGGYLYAGIAKLTPTQTNPGSPDANVFYIATEPGTYTNFVGAGGSLVVADGEVAIFKYNGTWSKEVTGAATAAQVTELGHDVNKRVKANPGKNLYTLDNAAIGRYLKNDGSLGENASYNVTDFIKVEAGDYCLSRDGGDLSRSNLFIGEYDANYAPVAFVSGTRVLTIPSGVSYMRVTCRADAVDGQIEKGTSRTDYEPYNPIGGYVSYEIEDGIVTEQKIATRAVTPDKMQPGAISSGLVANDSLGVEKMTFRYMGKNLFNLNDNDCLLGQYQRNSYDVGSNASYNLSGYIKVSPGETYKFSSDGHARNARFVTLFGEKMDIKDTYLENVDTIIVPAGVYYMRLTIPEERWDKWQVEKGDSVTEFEEYTTHISQSVLPTTSLGTLSQTIEGNIAAGEQLTLPMYPMYVKRCQKISFYADITTMGTLYIGKGYQYRSGVYIKIDNTNITTITCDLSGNETESTPVAHNLTMQTFIKIVISVGKDGVAHIILQTLEGENRTITSEGWMNAAGVTFVKSGTFVGANCTLSTINADLKNSLWLVGDSYLSIGSTGRWPYHILDFGIEDFATIAISGGKSDSGYNVGADLGLAFGLGEPKYLLYCLGMNDGSDTDAVTPSAEWLRRVQWLLGVCSKRGIIPIFTTIPCTASINHEGKNAWIRSSGFRYVDIAKAVHGETYTAGVLNWYEGYCSDGTHPTGKGARAIAAQVLTDFPEIMQY